MTPFYLLAVGILVTWRLTHLLAHEAGPWDIFGRLRRAIGTGFFAELVNCFYCLSLWIAAPLSFAVASSWQHRLLVWPALSAGAILLERLTTRSEPPPPPVFFEDQPQLQAPHQAPNLHPLQEDSHVLRS